MNLWLQEATTSGCLRCRHSCDQSAVRSINRLSWPDPLPSVTIQDFCHNGTMRTVNISDLKAQLSAHIQLVRDGEEVLVCDRNKPVARIVPCRLEGHSEQEQRLVARGVLTPPLQKRPASASWSEPLGNVPDRIMEQLWREERESR